jgi:magnesium-protoporphyrin O-methyltransferase
MPIACCPCEGIEHQFGSRIAERELRRFRRRGPIRSTRLLLREITEMLARVPSATLLDIGGGIGAVHHVLLDAGVREATQVDISSEYLNVARREATARGHMDRIRFIGGDFVDLAPTLPSADVVTLDRVICCYPDMERLVSRASQKTHHLLGAVYPRDVWWVRLGVGLVNRLTQLRRCPFRVFVHDPAHIEATLRARGLERAASRRTFVWVVAVYRRTSESMGNEPRLPRPPQHYSSPGR